MYNMILSALPLYKLRTLWLEDSDSEGSMFGSGGVGMVVLVCWMFDLFNLDLVFFSVAVRFEVNSFTCIVGWFFVLRPCSDEASMLCWVGAHAFVLCTLAVMYKLILAISHPRKGTNQVTAFTKFQPSCFTDFYWFSDPCCCCSHTANRTKTKTARVKQVGFGSSQFCTVVTVLWIRPPLSRLIKIWWSRSSEYYSTVNLL
jgi:hypothetical protein